MRPLSFALVVLLLLTARARAEFSLFKNIWGDVIVATDTAEAGKALTPPTAQQPVYYRGMSLGQKLGSIPGDEEPEQKQLNRFVADILRKQGYRGAPEGREPELFLVLQWGYLTPGSENLLWFLGYNPRDDIAAPSIPGKLGPEVWRRGMRSRAIETILEDSQGAIYGIIVTAFEFKSVRTADPVVYWQTRIGLPANGKSMAEALPAMLVAAGPAIGRPADKPVLLDADLARQGTVKFGELKFFDDDQEPSRDEDPGESK